MKRRPHADAVVVGGGLIGLACAAVLARDGAAVTLIDAFRPGAASSASAGMLAPSIERGEGPATEFALAARDAYPAFIHWLAEETRSSIPLNDRGILQVALTDAGVRGLQRAMAREADPHAEWLDAQATRSLEPALSHALGAVLHPRDGAVDNLALLAALSVYCRRSALVAPVEGAAVALSRDAGTIAVHTSDGVAHRGGRVVLAAGAWAGSITGLPRALPVTPLRGQMLAYRGSPLRRVIFGPRGYLVPREGAGRIETLAGATSERVEFDSSTTVAAEASLRAAASEILPPLASVRIERQWAGLRPMTPDLLPIIGEDPSMPALIYACGHSRNGVLLAPLTAECVSAIVRGVRTPHDLRAFAVTRFAQEAPE